MERRRPASGQMSAVGGGTGVGDPFTLETVKRTDSILLITATGTASAAFAVRLRYLVLSELNHEARDWILDALAVDKFDRDGSGPFVDVLGAFKTRGGGRIIVIVNERLKMMLSSISMSSVASGGPTLEIVATMKEALQRLGRAEDGKAGTE